MSAYGADGHRFEPETGYNSFTSPDLDEVRCSPKDSVFSEHVGRTSELIDEASCFGLARD